jgi:hypothetical protein
MSNQIILPNGDIYNPDIAQDHTGMTFAATAKNPRRDPRRDPRNFMRSPAWLACPNCKSEVFRVLVEDHPRGDGMMQLYCPKCHDAWPVLQMQQPQMSNAIAKQLGISVPDPAIDIEIDMGAD